MSWVKVGMHVMPIDWEYDDKGKEIAPEKIGAGPVVVDVKHDGDGYYKVRLNYDNWGIFTGVDFSELGCGPNDFWFDQDELHNY